MSDPPTHSASIFGFPERATEYHSAWIARAFTFWGAIGYLSGGVLAGPALASAMGVSAPPHAVVVVSTSLGEALKLLGPRVEFSLVAIGLALGLLGVLGWIREPVSYVYGRGAGRFSLQPARPIRFLAVGLLLFLFPGFAHGFADPNFARYLWGLGVFSSVSCVLVGSAYMAATAGKATFTAIAPALYAYAVATLVVVCGVSVLRPGPWTLNLLFGLTLPAPGLLLIGLHLGNEIRRRERTLHQEQAAESFRIEEEAAERRAAHEREAFDRHMRERDVEAEAARAARDEELQRRQELLQFLKASP
jgi:hypothetical protein